MGRKALFDREAVEQLLFRQSGVITRAQARGCAMGNDALQHRIRPGGPWQVLLPGIYAGDTGTPDTMQRLVAALLYAGPGSAITGPAALTLHRIRPGQIPAVDVLIPHERRRADASFVRVHRTSRMPDVQLWAEEIRLVPAARAIADAVRGLRDLPEVRAVVAAGVQQGLVGIAQLADELARGPIRGSAAFRQVLAEVADGIRSSAEGDLRTLVRRERLPDPVYNPRLYAGEEFIAAPDAWWEDAGVAGEIESRQWHLSPRGWERTLARDARMSAHGIIVLHFPPGRLRGEPRLVAAEIRSALDAGRGRGRLNIRALPCG